MIFLIIFPADCKAGMVDEVLLIEVRCKYCGRGFFVCRRCWRGQIYCGKRCRKICQRQMHREAQRQYRQTEKGKKTHREYEEKRRIKNNKKTVADVTTTPWEACDIEPPERPGNQPKCLFCGLSGIVVAQFPRRAYGGKVFSEEMDLKREGYY